MENCKNCQEQFEIRPEDHEFYEKINWPTPTHCPDCRRQKRFAIRNERHLHRRSCDKCSKSVISVYPQESPYIVYCNECWYKDDWDPTEYAKDFDFSKAFFDQYKEMELVIPHFAIFQEGENQNCEYTNYGVGNKSCYLAFCAFSEDIYHSHGPIQSKSCVDCGTVTGCELCYECMDCTGCYNLFFSKDCYNCSDSYFLEDCIGCKNCYLSAGLRNQEYVFKNQKLSQQEYEEKIQSLKLSNELIEESRSALREISLKIPKKYYHGRANENVSGDYIDNCKNLYKCFDCSIEFEDSAYCDFSGMNTHHVYDAYATGIGTEFSVEINGTTYANNCKCLYYTRTMDSCEYCQICFNGKNLFGCFGLNHKKYCILNKQYTKEEYEEFYPKIIEHMKKTGEYGEFFPIKNSPVYYNDSLAFDYFPMKKEEALAKGYKWHEKEQASVTGQHQSCKKCSKQFKYISQEEKFYEKMKLPHPEVCPECRYQKRFKLRNPFKLYDRNCQKCQAPFQTSYSPEQPEIVYCEPCYLSEK